MTPKEREVLSIALTALHAGDGLDGDGLEFYLLDIISTLTDAQTAELAIHDIDLLYEKYCMGEPDAEAQGSTI